MLMVRDLNNLFATMSGMPVNSRGAKKMLKNAGIDTNSAQYKKVIQSMSSGKGGAVGYTNVQAIKNRMKNYDKDGNFIAPGSVPGMDATGIPLSERHKIISVSEESRQDVFEKTKEQFVKYGGSGAGDGSYRNEMFRRYQLSVPKEDRLKGSWTLGQYEKAYQRAFADAAKKADPKWEPGKPIPAGVLDGVSREDVDRSLVKTNGEYGETFVSTSVNIRL